MKFADYHERSKHYPDRFAPGPGRLDWANQPDPFRHYAGAPRLELPLLDGDLPVGWNVLTGAAAADVRPVDTAHLAHLLELSLGLADWKSYRGHRWALRCNPSSGNLHPTEGYVIVPPLPGLPAGVYHYQPRDHCLERRAAAPFTWSGGVLVALTTIHWREAWKYGLRAFRYCQHDCGHALAAVGYGAAVLGWGARLLDDWGDRRIACLTGADRGDDFPAGDGEAPEAVLWVGPGEPPAAADVLETLSGASWMGRANALSHEHRAWPDITAVARATTRPPVEVRPWRRPGLPSLPPVSPEPASTLIRRRRSAQAFDGMSGIAAPAFFRMADALLARDVPPWVLWPYAPRVHPVIFVHRVEDLEPGVYCLVRDPQERHRLGDAMGGKGEWAAVPGAPAHLPLFRIAAGDTRRFAAMASCHQDIAADSAFALAMLARFDDIGADDWLYRRRFWEAGILGQVLYLEAEAAGVQGTGIGCYFDETAHQALGLDTTRYQDLYHFTVGRAVLDARLESEPPYAHLEGRDTRPVV